MCVCLALQYVVCLHDNAIRLHPGKKKICMTKLCLIVRLHFWSSGEFREISLLSLFTLLQCGSNFMIF